MHITNNRNSNRQEDNSMLPDSLQQQLSTYTEYTQQQILESLQLLSSSLSISAAPVPIANNRSHHQTRVAYIESKLEQELAHVVRNGFCFVVDKGNFGDLVSLLETLLIAKNKKCHFIKNTLIYQLLENSIEILNQQYTVKLFHVFIQLFKDLPPSQSSQMYRLVKIINQSLKKISPCFNPDLRQDEDRGTIKGQMHLILAKMLGFVHICGFQYLTNKQNNRNNQQQLAQDRCLTIQQYQQKHYKPLPSYKLYHSYWQIYTTLKNPKQIQIIKQISRIINERNSQRWENQKQTINQIIDLQFKKLHAGFIHLHAQIVTFIREIGVGVDLCGEFGESVRQCQGVGKYEIQADEKQQNVVGQGFRQYIIDLRPIPQNISKQCNSRQFQLIISIQIYQYCKLILQKMQRNYQLCQKQLKRHIVQQQYSMESNQSQKNKAFHLSKAKKVQIYSKKLCPQLVIQNHNEIKAKIVEIEGISKYFDVNFSSWNFHKKHRERSKQECKDEAIFKLIDKFWENEQTWLKLKKNYKKQKNSLFKTFQKKATVRNYSNQSFITQKQRQSQNNSNYSLLSVQFLNQSNIVDHYGAQEPIQQRMGKQMREFERLQRRLFTDMKVSAQGQNIEHYISSTISPNINKINPDSSTSQQYMIQDQQQKKEKGVDEFNLWHQYIVDKQIKWFKDRKQRQLQHDSKRLKNKFDLNSEQNLQKWVNMRGIANKNVGLVRKQVIGYQQHELLNDKLDNSSKLPLQKQLKKSKNHSNYARIHEETDVEDLYYDLL